MGIGLATYRLRIGLFGPGRGFRGYRCDKYTPYIKGTDIHYRTFLSGILLVMIFGSSATLINLLTPFATVVPEHLTPTNVCLPFSIEGHFGKCPQDGTMWLRSPYVNYTPRILQLSMDVETNPGPVSENDKTDILRAIKDSGDSLRADIMSVTQDVRSMQNELKSVYEICNQMKADIASINARQEILDENLNKIDHELENLKMDKDMILLDIDKVNENCEQNTDKLQNMEEALNKMERNAIKRNVRVFGFAETQTDNVKNEIITGILKIARPDMEWNPDSITDFYRVGKPGNYTRTLVLTFSTVDFKFALFEGRDRLREKGIKIAGDLTSLEKQKLYDLKRKGQTGYFYKGKLHTRPNTVNNRYFVNARRRNDYSRGTENIEMQTHNSSNVE